jgi:ABC-type lipoprotein export system ATPase subunit
MIAKLFKHKPHDGELQTAQIDETSPRPIIKMNKIVKSYKTAAGEFVVLKGVYANFYKGEFVGVIGKSGSGKSTLINMITGIDRPTSGEVYVGDIPVHKLSENQMSIWRGRNLGIVFQFFQLLPTLSLLENIMLPMDFCNTFPHRLRRERAMDLLKMVEMEDHADKLPSAVSGGQQQRVAIARALANDPPIIIADEPTGNLDSRTAEAIFKMFEELVKQGKTIVMVTHDSSLAKRVSRTVLIADGEMVNEWVARALPTLTHQQMLEATHRLQSLKYASGETIIKQDQPADRFYIITQGMVEVALKRPGGHDVIVARMGPGEYVGEIETFRGDKAIATVRAGQGPVEALTIDKETFMSLISDSEATRNALEHIINLREKENIAARGE